MGREGWGGWGVRVAPGAVGREDSRGGLGQGEAAEEGR